MLIPNLHKTTPLAASVQDMDLVRLIWWHPSVRPDKSKDLFWDDLIHPYDLNKLIKSDSKINYPEAEPRGIS
jgi:hypothetical protein